ncbi:hypothetical protein [Paraburkholderia sp. JPY419]|uniref:hypothetical protein n=1 Tax=Paraburkholderia sp. JPY419 TaxID=667660 RepID=UPI003D25CC13
MAAQQAGRIGGKVDRLKSISSWAWRYWLRFFVYWAVPIFLSLIALYLSHWSETSISVAGARLQVVGFGYTLWGVVNTWRQFNLPSLSEHTAEARREFPRPRPDIVGTIDMTATLQASSALMAALGTVEPRDVISRLDALERDYKKLRADVANHYGETQEQFRNHAADLNVERTERAKDDNTLRSALREFATGGLNLIVCGIIVGIAATAFSTFSHGIAVLMGGATADPTCVQIVVQPALPRTTLVADARLVRT